MVCTSLGSLLRPLFYFLCYIHFSLSVDFSILWHFSKQFMCSLILVPLSLKIGLSK